MEVIDSVNDYAAYMKEIFDFPKIKTLIQGSGERKPFNILIDAMNGGKSLYNHKKIKFKKKNYFLLQE